MRTIHYVAAVSLFIVFIVFSLWLFREIRTARPQNARDHGESAKEVDEVAPALVGGQFVFHETTYLLARVHRSLGFCILLAGKGTSAQTGNQHVEEGVGPVARSGCRVSGTIREKRR